MDTGPGKMSVITGAAAIGFLLVLAVAAGIASSMDPPAWFYGVLGLLGMAGWAAHIVGIGFGVEALRSRTPDRRAGLVGLLINLVSLVFWLGIVPVALS